MGRHRLQRALHQGGKDLLQGQDGHHQEWQAPDSGYVAAAQGRIVEPKAEQGSGWHR